MESGEDRKQGMESINDCGKEYIVNEEETPNPMKEQLNRVLGGRKNVGSQFVTAGTFVTNMPSLHLICDNVPNGSIVTNVFCMVKIYLQYTCNVDTSFAPEQQTY